MTAAGLAKSSKLVEQDVTRTKGVHTTKGSSLLIG